MQASTGFCPLPGGLGAGPRHEFLMEQICPENVPLSQPLYFYFMKEDQSGLVGFGGGKLTRTPKLFLRGTETYAYRRQTAPHFPSEQVREHTLWGAAVQVPQIVQLVCQLHQLGPWAAAGCPLHLQPLSLQLGQRLVVCYLLHQTPHLLPEVQLHLLQGGVCIFHRVVEQGRLGTGFHSAL